MEYNSEDQYCDENVYVNTMICIAKRKSDISLDAIELQTKERQFETESTKSEIDLDAKDLSTSLEQYETLQRVTRENNDRNKDEGNSDKSISWKDQSRQIKIIIYALSLMLVMLYIIVATASVLIVFSLPKSEGTWSLWSAWTRCDTTCGNGTQTRLRMCSNPQVSTEELACIGSSTDLQQCQQDPCPVNFWSNWGSWGSCSESCDGGIKSRRRTCTHQSTLGKGCDGSSEQVVLCNKNACEVHGTWTRWSEWSNCDVICDNGTQTRYRLCFNPTVPTEQLKCNGSSTETIKCQGSPCHDGAWSIWGIWGSCSESCGGGIRSRLRTCTNPRPSPLGKYCDGSPEEVELCNKNACNDGAWSNWGSWGSCSVSCGGGIRSRLRTCTNPRPSPLGKDCDGSTEEVELCNKNACVDGAWSNWGTWGSCSESCGRGIKSRLRTCTNPRPSPLGKGCDGSSEQVVMCNKNTCNDHKVAFLAYGSTTVTYSTVLKFPTISFNSGNGYSTSTGRFTCKIPGIYNFAVTLTKQRRDIDQINAYLRINGVNKLQLYADPYDSAYYDVGSYSLTVTGNFYLTTNEFVEITAVPNYLINDFRTSFTGVLVIPN